MAVSKSIIIDAHNNIYTNSQRKIRVEYCIPKNGVNTSTAMVVLVPGFWGNVDSNVYKKMRDRFADEYNMITIQCEYFGSQYMQTSQLCHIDDDVLKNILSEEEIFNIQNGYDNCVRILDEKGISLNAKEIMKETLEEFNDMSFMQAIDVIRAVEYIKKALDENGLEFDSNRIIGYGHSHGAYLLHLSNRLVPNLFSYIIDNSAWIKPVYLYDDRRLNMIGPLNKGGLSVKFSYLAKEVIKNKEQLSLEKVYKNYNGIAQIISFQGTDDNLVDYEKKRKIINSIKRSKFVLVSEKDVDNKKYKSNKHGLGADYLELFKYALQFEETNFKMEKVNTNYDILIDTMYIKVDRKNGISQFSIKCEDV